ncbi:hypothetical protein ACFCT7_10305 [Fulvivirgaceae bacterium LMO-SS25]
MKNKLSFLFMLLFIVFQSLESFSQLTGIGSVIDVNGNKTRMNYRAGEAVSNDAILKPYLSENYREGVVTFTDESTKKGAFRYKVDEELLEFQDESKNYVWNTILKFEWLNPDTGKIEYYENLKKIWPKSEYGGFVRKISDKVMAKALIDYVAPTRDPSFDMGDPKSYLVVAEYYFAFIDGKLVELPKPKNDFFKIFGKHEKEVKKQASKAKLKHTSDEGVIAIIDIYESLNNK